jgi:hypothetical protein
VFVVVERRCPSMRVARDALDYGMGDPLDRL